MYVFIQIESNINFNKSQLTQCQLNKIAIKSCVMVKMSKKLDENYATFDELERNQ